VKFLIGTQSADFISVSLATVSAASLLGASGSTVSTALASLSAINAVNSAINVITRDRALVGAYESQFNFSAQDISTNVQNITAASSVILDADVAQVKSSLSANDVKTQAAIAALSQASQLPQELLHLLQQ
jgi:flagellin